MTIEKEKHGNSCFLLSCCPGPQTQPIANSVKLGPGYGDHRRHGKARDPWAAGLIYKNGRLSRSQYDRRVDFRAIPYPAEITMNHATGMEVVKAVGDTRGFKRYRGREEDETNKFDLVRVWVKVDVFAWFYARYPNRNEPERVEGDAEEGYDVRMRQMFPLDNIAVKHLVVLSMARIEKDENVTKHLSLL